MYEFEWPATRAAAAADAAAILHAVYDVHNIYLCSDHSFLFSDLNKYR